MSVDDGLADFMGAAAAFPTWSLPEWVEARDDQLLLRRTGWDLPTQTLSGFLLLSMRLAFLIACGAMRRLDRPAWETRMREVETRLNVVSTHQSQRDGQTQEAC